MIEINENEKQLLEYLLERDGLNPDWYFDCYDFSEQAENTVDKYLMEVSRIMTILDP